jgi:hypothetical protein
MKAYFLIKRASIVIFWHFPLFACNTSLIDFGGASGRSLSMQSFSDVMRPSALFKKYNEQSMPLKIALACGGVVSVGLTIGLWYNYRKPAIGSASTKISNYLDTKKLVKNEKEYVLQKDISYAHKAASSSGCGSSLKARIDACPKALIDLCFLFEDLRDEGALSSDVALSTIFREDHETVEEAKSWIDTNGDQLCRAYFDKRFDEIRARTLLFELLKDWKNRKFSETYAAWLVSKGADLFCRVPSRVVVGAPTMPIFEFLWQKNVDGSIDKESHFTRMSTFVSSLCSQSSDKLHFLTQFWHALYIYEQSTFSLHFYRLFQAMLEIEIETWKQVSPNMLPSFYAEWLRGQLILEASLKQEASRFSSDAVAKYIINSVDASGLSAIISNVIPQSHAVRQKNRCFDSLKKIFDSLIKEKNTPIYQSIRGLLGYQYKYPFINLNDQGTVPLMLIMIDQYDPEQDDQGKTDLKLLSTFWAFYGAQSNVTQALKDLGLTTLSPYSALYKNLDLVCDQYGTMQMLNLLS